MVMVMVRIRIRISVKEFRIRIRLNIVRVERIITEPPFQVFIPGSGSELYRQAELYSPCT